MSRPAFEITLDSAMKLWQEGQHDTAAQQLQRLVSSDPNNAQSQHYLGVHHAMHQRFDVAQNCFEHAAKTLHSAQLFYNWGCCLMDQGLWQEALTQFDRALSVPECTSFERAQTHWQIAGSLYFLNQLILAKTHLKAAEALLSDELDLWRKIAGTYDQWKSFEDSLRVFELIRQRFPKVRYGYNGAANALGNLGQRELAVEVFEQGIALFPDDFVLLTNLASTCNRLARSEKALAYSTLAVKLAPLDAEVLYNHASILESFRRYDEALSFYESALHAKPQFAEAHFAHACTRLRLGDFVSGWRGYEWRWSQKDVVVHGEKGVLWLGQFDMRGKILYVHVEQGFGDIIQFARLIPLLVRQGIRVIFNPPAELHELMQSIQGIEQFWPWDTPAPVYDAQIPLVSLPLALQLSLDQIPHNSPYLTPPQAQQNQWRQKIEQQASGKKIGLAWCGNPENKTDAFRSMSLAQMTPLIEAGHKRGIRFYSLQKKVPQSDQVLFDKLCKEDKLIDLSADFVSFSNTAALINLLDQIISVETVIAHLAGALNQPVWIPLQYAACWRWLLNRDDSPWYPSARLFRQTEAGNWAGVVAKLVDSLD